MTEPLCERCRKPRDRHNSGVGCTIFTLPDSPPPADELTALRERVAALTEVVERAKRHAENIGITSGSYYETLVAILSQPQQGPER